MEVQACMLLLEVMLSYKSHLRNNFPSNTVIKNNYYKFASGHYYCHSNFIWWYMGILGSVFCYSTCDFSKGGFKRLAFK